MQKGFIASFSGEEWREIIDKLLKSFEIDGFLTVNSEW